MIAVFLFDKTGNMAKPWADAGFLCYCVDIQHAKGERRVGNTIFVGADARHWLPPKEPCAFFAAFPPCTHLAVSGSRWFVGKGLRLLSESIELFARSAELAEWLGCKYLIENPVSTISTYWRKHDHSFDPSDYGDPYTKKTCLWTGGGFVMPPKIAPGDLFAASTIVEATQGSKMHLIPPSADRANLRSETPMGFAYAVFYANRPNVEVCA